MRQILTVLLLCLQGFCVDSLSTTVVSGHKKNSTGAATEVFTSEEWEGKSEDVQKFLATQPGFYLKQSGGQGGFNQISWRGMSSNYFWVEFKKIPLNSADGSSVHIQNLPLAWMDSLSMHQGVLPAGIPSGYFAALQLNPQQRGEKSLSTSYHIPQGHQWDFQFSMDQNKTFGEHYIHANAFSNQFEYWNRNQTPYNTDDDQFSDMQNAQSYLFSSLHSFPISKQVALNFFQEQMSGGIYGLEGRPTETAKYSKRVFANSITFESPARDLSLSYKFHEVQSEWGNQDQLYLSTASDVHLRSYLHYIKPNYIEKLPFPYFPAQLSISPSYEWYLSRHLSSLTHFKDWQARRDQFQTSITLPYHFGSHHLNSRLGYTFLSDHQYIGDSPEDINTTEFQEYEYGVEYSLIFKSFLWSLLSSQNYKASSLLQKFGGSKGVLPNVDLKPETIQLYQSKLQFHFLGHTFKSIAYIQDLENKITPFVQYQLLTWRNTGKTRIAGLENELELSLRPMVLKGHYSFNKSQDRGEESAFRLKKLPDTPQHQSFAEAGFLYLGFHPWVQYQYQSSTYRDRANLNLIPSIQKWNAGLRYLQGNLEFSLRCNNLSGVYHENAYSSFPYPKRDWAFKLKYFI